MEKHVHAELIKAWADGAEIERLVFVENWENIKVPLWHKTEEYRIKPGCEYSYQDILKLGGDDAVVLYKQFLDDARQLESFDNYCGMGEWIQMESPEDDPLGEFIHEWKVSHGKIRKKKQTITQVLWVRRPLHGDVPARVTQQWVQDGGSPISFGATKIDDWHKVPTLTREVEV